ncbi:ATP-binding protein [Paenibacillus sp. OAE614]|uniref:AAA family ATPase n=1 Tax=Paenibacillus sp. OAE614 TaxID=2663804 RepID=UPI00178C140E
MNGDTKQIYLISGPLGVGKSTTSKELARLVERCVLIEGDDLLHMQMTEPSPTWEERLSLAWMNILSVTRNFIQSGFHVVIDFVVEDEFEWFCRQIADLNVQLKYAVLHADEETIAERLRKRGDIHSLDRSLFLLNKLKSAAVNADYLVGTNQKDPAETAAEVIQNDRFHVHIEM